MMLKISSMFAGAAILVAGAAMLETPAAAQNSVSEIIVFGTDPCPRSTDDQVVVCARKPESERYRIPEVLRSTGSIQAREAWANKAKVLETVGATGTNSCSPVGPGGFTGCLTRVIREARDERRQQAEDYNPEQ